MPDHTGGDWHTGFSGDAPAGYHTEHIVRMQPDHLLVRSNVEEIDKIGSIWVPKTSRESKKLSTVGIVVLSNVRWELRDIDAWVGPGDFVMYGKYTGTEITFKEDRAQGFYYRLCPPESIYFVFQKNIGDEEKTEQSECSGPKPQP